jgi:hypothetical protein
MASSKGTTRRVIHRSSVSGRIVTAAYTRAHPRTTETQHVRVPAPSKPKGK